jgi:hypothetical protein
VRIFTICSLPIFKYYKNDGIKRDKILLKHVIRMSDKQCVAVLVGNPIGKRPLGRPRNE